MAELIAMLGGSGFVGTQIANRLVRRGHRIRVLTRRRESHRHLLVLPTLELVEADVHDPAQLRHHLRGADAAINLVGILNERGNDGSGFRRAHVELADKLAEACRSSAVRRLLHMSSLNADAAHGPSHYLRSKGEAEDLVHGAAGPELRVTSFRPSVIFGPRDSFFNRFAALLKLSPLAFPLACPRARFAPVYVEDVAAAFVQGLQDPATYGRRYDLCGPKTYTLEALVRYTAETLGLRRWVIPLNDGLSRLQAQVLEWLPGKPFSRDNYLSMQVDSVCRNGSGLEALGIHPTALESVVPAYLGRRSVRARYMQLRSHARRPQA